MSNSTNKWGPTYEEMLHPHLMDPQVRKAAIEAKEQDPLNPINLYNITWRRPDNGFPYYVLPPSLTGIKANIVVLYAKGFPSGSHKVGPTYSVLQEQVAAGLVDPKVHTLVWPSTGNYGVGGAWVSARMNYKSLVVLPEDMSKERFDLIRSYGSDVIATTGSESNVKEIYDKTHELLALDPDRIRILNQFDSFANYRFHYYVTGSTMVELVREMNIGNGRIAAVVATVGSAGTIASGDRVKQVFPECRIVAGEPVQCPTLSLNGYGSHDIQGIGDKHVTWIHNVMNMDGVVQIDDRDCKTLLKVINNPEGKNLIAGHSDQSDQSDSSLATTMAETLGISGAANILCAIKTAKYYDLEAGDNILIVATDAIDRYHSVLAAMPEIETWEVKGLWDRLVLGQPAEPFFEGDRHNRLRWHNLKYYTWVEQQGKSVDMLDAMKHQDFWLAEQAKVKGAF